MQVYKRTDGAEQPFWPCGPFKIRLPFIHYRWEMAEMLQALIMFVVSLGMIPLLQTYLGLPYDVALAYVVVCGVGFMLPALLGVPFVPGWITPGIPVVLLFLGDFEPGPEAIQALFALQFLVFVIFLFLGITRLGSVLVRLIPNSMKGGIIIGAGIAALIGEIETGGRLAATPFSLVIGSLVCLYLMFSVSFKGLTERVPFARKVVNYGMVPGMLVAIFVGIIAGEYEMPDVRFGITAPAFAEMWNYLPFTLGFPDAKVFMLAIPTAVIAYIIAFGDIIVGQSLMQRADELRTDEVIENNIDRVHLVTAVRNAMHAFFAPSPGLAGPLWTAVAATMAERYKYGRHAMESIYSGAGTFWITGFLALFLLPLVSFFQPVLPIALSLTLILTGYICLMVGFEQLNNNTERGIAGTMGVVLAVYGAGWGLAAGAALYILIERTHLLKFRSPSDLDQPEAEQEQPR
ncbi:solute carrier family 23 protein [Halopseudomonas bauzanensis]|uniref:solute carrier family 23 protein n=1 Tax=Halopseudomonas bauzanensis TaxID=653930 RepID=UPI002552FD5C|nr:solute carrier family 23 protein [Halopseudomonas bauzanensis]